MGRVWVWSVRGVGMECVRCGYEVGELWEWVGCGYGVCEVWEWVGYGMECVRCGSG